MTKRILTKSEIDSILASRFDIKADVQVVPVKGENRTLYQLEHVSLGRRMTMTGLERLCHRIARSLGAELEGSVNIDFVSCNSEPSFTMLAEVYNRQ